MATEANKELILAAGELVRTELGQRFLKAFGTYAEETRENLVMSPPDMLAHNQGTARALTVLYKLLLTAPTEAEKMRAAIDAKNSRSKP